MSLDDIVSGPSRPERFRVEVVREHEAFVVRPHGELDLTSRGELTRRVLELSRAGARHLVLDLRRTTFVDPSGIWAIRYLAEMAEFDDYTFEIVQGPPRIARVFHLAGLEAALPFRRAER